MGLIVAVCAVIFLIASADAALAAGDTQGIVDPLNKPVTVAEHSPEPRWMGLIQWGILIAAPLILISLWIKGIIRPSAFSKGKPKRDVQGMPALVWLACAGVMFMAPQIGGTTALLVAPGLASDHSMRSSGLLQGSAYLFACLVAGLLIYFIIPRAQNAGLRYRKMDFLTGLGVLLLTLPILQSVTMVGTLVARKVTGTDPDLIAHGTLREMLLNRHDPWTWSVIAASVIGAPIIEELTYRLFLQSTLLRATRSHWVSLLASSAIFALVHRLMAEPVPWHVMPTLFTLGLAAGIAFERTGRVLVPIVIHASFNALNVALVFLLV